MFVFTYPYSRRDCARNRLGPSRSAYGSKYIWNAWTVEHYLETIERTFTAHIPPQNWQKKDILTKGVAQCEGRGRRDKWESKRVGEGEVWMKYVTMVRAWKLGR